jgi:hypothetical protein
MVRPVRSVSTPLGLASFDTDIWAKWERSFLIVRTTTLSTVRILISSIKLNRRTHAQRVLSNLQ